MSLNTDESHYENSVTCMCSELHGFGWGSTHSTVCIHQDTRWLSHCCTHVFISIVYYNNEEGVCLYT